MIEVQLTTSGLQLELYIAGYAFPEFHTGRDANALTCEIELDLQHGLDLHAAHNQLILHTFKLKSFVDQLRALEHRQGRATLADPDQQSGDQFGLTIRQNATQGMLDGFLADSAATRLNFEMINIDRAFVRDTLAQFAAIVKAFPVRGDISAD